MGDHMFRDLALSRDTMVEYHERIGPKRAAEQKLTAMVLQQSFWPFSSRTAQDAIIPVSVRHHLFFRSSSFLNPMSIDAKRA
jgi:cullin-4